MEQRIAALLGDHMPLSEGNGPNSLLQHFMSLRLLLLRCDDRRSSDQKEFLDVIKKSYKGYSQDNKRSDSELASLLVRDWMFLSAANLQVAQGSSPVLSSANSQHQCHIMSPATNPQPTIGMPTTMPSTLVSLQPPPTLSQVIAYPNRSDSSNKLVHHRHPYVGANATQPMSTNDVTSREVYSTYSATIVPPGELSS